MPASAGLVVTEQIVFVGVHDQMRHSIRRDERLHTYPDGGVWAFARCFRPAWEPPAECVRAAEKWPACDECASLEAEERDALTAEATQ